MTPEEIRQTLFTLADLAAAETMPIFRQATAVENKLEKGFDPVTLADQNAERAIRNWLQENLPDHGVIGEEHGICNQDAEYCWILDPVDGTRAFISGLPGWGTLVGLYRNGLPLAGMMAQPFTGEYFYSQGNGSFLKKGDGAQKLKTSSVTKLEDAILMTTDPFIISGNDQAAFSKVREKTKLTRYGYDCYAYAMVAAGHIDLVIETGLNSYDIAALIPIVEQAGGLVTNWEGGSANKGGRIVAAAGKTLHSEVLKTLNS